MWKRVKVLLKDEPSMKTLYKYQMFIALKLFTEIPWRNTFATLSIDTKQPNHIIQPRKGNMKIHLSEHKTSRLVLSPNPMRLRFTRRLVPIWFPAEHP